MPEATGVRRVDGSQPEAVAYRVNPSIQLQKAVRYTFKQEPLTLITENVFIEN